MPDERFAGPCPDCDDGVMIWHRAPYAEPHGESGWEEWFECDRCGFTEQLK